MLTLQNISKATDIAFSDFALGSDKKLKKLISLLSHDSPLDQMVAQEFYYEFNKRFSNLIFDSDKGYQFPSSIPKNSSVWLLEWKKYFDKKYEGYSTPLRELDFSVLDSESDKLAQAFSKSLKTEQLNMIRNNIIKVYQEEDSRYLEALQNTVFCMSLLKHFNHDYEEMEDEMRLILEKYYASFDNKDKEEFKTSFYGKSFNFDEVRAKKIKYFEPKNNNESQFILFLSKNKEKFAEEFNRELGIYGDKEGSIMKEMFYKMAIRQRHDKLDEELPKKEVKKEKIKI